MNRATLNESVSASIDAGIRSGAICPDGGEAIQGRIRDFVGSGGESYPASHPGWNRLARALRLPRRSRPASTELQATQEEVAAMRDIHGGDPDDPDYLST